MKPFLLVASAPRPLKFRYKNAAEADVPNVLCFRFLLILSWKTTVKEKTSWQLQFSIWDQQDSLLLLENLS